jgi:hypothetical protein
MRRDRTAELGAPLSRTLASGEGPSLEVPAMTDDPSPPFVANVIHPRPGRCFRYVYGNGRNGNPAPCPEPVRWRGSVVNPAGKRIAVEVCERHAGDVADRLG